MEPNKLLSYINCIKLLENYNQNKSFSITSIIVESLNDKVSGMMAEYYKLIIYLKIGDKNLQQTFFCKKLIMFHKIQEIMGKAQGAYEKEEFIYKTFMDQLQKIEGLTFNFAPKCYLTLNHDILILDDLLEKGYKVNHENFDLDHLEIGLKTIAEFHACSLILETDSKQRLLDTNPEIIFADSLYRRSEDYLGRKWFKNCLNSVLKIIDLLPTMPLPKEELKTKFIEQANSIYEIITPSTKFRNVLCHGDLSKLNMLFKYENDKPVDCKIVDYQALRYNPPAHDVINFIYLCSSSKFRKEHYEHLLQYYYDALAQKLKENNLELENFIPKSEYEETIKFIWPQAIIQKAFYNTMNPVICHFPNILKDQDLYKKYVYEDRSPECVIAFGKSNFFRDIMIDVITEFCLGI